MGISVVGIDFTINCTSCQSDREVAKFKMYAVMLVSSTSVHSGSTARATNGGGGVCFCEPECSCVGDAQYPSPSPMLFAGPILSPPLPFGLLVEHRTTSPSTDLPVSVRKSTKFLRIVEMGKAVSAYAPGRKESAAACIIVHSEDCSQHFETSRCCSHKCTSTELRTCPKTTVIFWEQQRTGSTF